MTTSALAHAAARPRVIIAGGGPTGMATALNLASREIPSTVVEAYGRVATRANLLNLSPSTVDELARIGAVPAIERMQPIAGVDIIDDVAGRVIERASSSAKLAPDATRRAEVADVIAAITGGDRRPWGRITIGDLENALRETAETRYPGLIQLLPDSKVTGIEQTRSGVRALVEPTGGGAEQVLEGAYLVSATGGRSPSGLAAQPSGPTIHFVGGDFPRSRESLTRVTRQLGDGRELTTRGAAHTTIGLHNAAPGGNSLLWAQIGEDARNVDPEVLKRVLTERARMVGVHGELLATRPPVPVTVQLGASHQAVQGRMLMVGDELQAPYFPNSTGANFGIVTARHAAAAIDDALRAGDEAGAAAALAGYERTILGASDEMLAVNRATMDRAMDTNPATPAVDLLAP